MIPGTIVFLRKVQNPTYFWVPIVWDLDYIAYIDGKDIIQAESWIKKHRSHRGHSGTMDEKLYELYFPYGEDNDEHINDDELALHDNVIEYINDNVTHNDELDTWLNMLDNYQRSGRII